MVVRSGRVVEQNQLLFELFGRSIDEELIRGISMIKDGSMIRENIPRRKGLGGNCFTRNQGEKVFSSRFLHANQTKPQ